MKGILQYSANGSTGWASVGTVRASKGQDYTIEAITGANRAGEVETLGYKIKVRALALKLAGNFVQYDKYYFRIYFQPPADQVIGSSGLSFICIQNHYSALSNKPSTGYAWADYWTQGGSAITEWQLSKYYATDLYLGLEEHPYTLDFDGLLQIQKIFYHTIQLEFLIDRVDIDEYLVVNYRDQ